MEVLLIGDNEKTADEISMYLRIRYPEISVIQGTGGNKITDRLRHLSFELIILHSSSSNSDIVNLVKMVRQYTASPLLVLGEGENSEERALVLEAGADEFILRPFSLIEFLARCGAVLRRMGTPLRDGRIVSFDGLEIHLDCREVFLSGARVRLTPIEYEILAKLAQVNGHLVDQDDLLEHVWGTEYRGDANLLKTYIYRLRRKLEIRKGASFIINERGFGYRLARGQLVSELTSPMN